MMWLMILCIVGLVNITYERSMHVMHMYSTARRGGGGGSRNLHSPQNSTTTI